MVGNSHSTNKNRQILDFHSHPSSSASSMAICYQPSKPTFRSGIVLLNQYEFTEEKVEFGALAPSSRVVSSLSLGVESL